MRIDHRLRPRLVLLAAVTLAVSPAAHPQQEAETPAVGVADLPDPDVAALEPAVADQLTEMRQFVVREMTEFEKRPDELASSIGELGRLYLAYELYRPAEQCLSLAARLGPRNFSWPYHLAYLAQQEGRLEDAALLYERSLSILPTVTPALVRLGQVYSEQNRPEAAEWVLRQALANDPVNAAAGANLGELLVSLERFEEAAQLLAAALEQNPGADRLYYPLGLAYRGLGREREARQALAKRGTVGIRPADPLIDGLSEKALGERVMLLRGRAAYQAGRFEEAAAEFRRALEGKPDSIPALINLGTTLGRLDDIEGAMEQFRKAIELAPANSTAHLNLGTMLASHGKLEEAVNHLEEAAMYSQEDPGIRWELAETQRRLGRFEDARLHYQAAIRLAPPGEMARFREAQTLSSQDRYAEARDRLEEGLEVLPRSLNLSIALARILAMSPDLEVRNGVRAQELALTVVGAAPTMRAVETAAAAYAEAGLCDKAAEYQHRTIEAAMNRDDPQLVAELEKMLEHYENDRPCRYPLEPAS
ncbi:MAG: tetratricopeptide repeat protein [Thermoanaerobaculia bacterium]